GDDEAPIEPAGGGDKQAAEPQQGHGGDPAPQPAPEEPAEEPEEPAETPPTSAPAPLDGVPQPAGTGGSGEAERLHLAGYDALQSGDYNTAIDLNTRAIEAFPEGTTWQDDMNYAYALFSLGQALRLAGRPDEAIPVLEARLDIPNQTATVQEELEKAQKQAG
ncbi:MAG: hypothetical protein ACRDJY_09540, partial [Thermoleophilaceae bacterium]